MRNVHLIVNRALSHTRRRDEAPIRSISVRPSVYRRGIHWMDFLEI